MGSGSVLGVCGVVLGVVSEAGGGLGGVLLAGWWVCGRGGRGSG